MGQYLSSYFYGTSATQPIASHIIFDFDGIMIDSEIQYSKAMQRCVEPHGKQFTLDQKLNIMGRKKSGKF
jgi:beta-phosphoglucomutase-like phosphatase (HAD superfamily)